MMTKHKPTAPLSVRIDAQLKADIEALAASDFGRSVTNYVEMVLRQHVAAKMKKGKEGEPQPKAPVKTS